MTTVVVVVVTAVVVVFFNHDNSCAETDEPTVSTTSQPITRGRPATILRMRETNTPSSHQIRIQTMC